MYRNIFRKCFMTPFILIPLIIAYCKGYRAHRVFCVCDLYPLLATVLCHGVFIVFAWCGNHYFVQYAAWLQRAIILSLLLPILRRRITYPAYVGVGITLAGTFMNHLVIKANGGHMPSAPTLSRLIGFYRDGQLESATIDSLHTLFDGSCKLPLLADYIDLGVCILSPGDVLIHAFASIIVYYTVKAVCPKKEKSACA
jgi:hypothetical protein